jgi:AraC-like DNA-binding protein
MFISMLIVRALVAELARMDVDLPQLLRNAGIPTPNVAHPSEGIPVRDYARLVRGAIRATGDQSLGLTLGTRTPGRALHVISHLLHATSTLREAHAALGKYAPALWGALRFELKEQKDLGYFGFSFACEPDEFSRFAAEYTLTIALSIARSISAQHVPLTEVWFSHPRPPYASRYNEVFGCPVQFDKPMNALVFQREILDLPHPYADPMLSAILRGAADQLLVEPALNDNYSQRVRQALRYEPDLAHVNFDRLASRWGMTRRTLRRRLRDEGKVLSDLLDEARFREASKELTRPSESIKEIAERLGYAETSSFHRAFKRWAGVTPSAFRKRSQAAAE